MKTFGGLEIVLKHLNDRNDLGPIAASTRVREEPSNGGEDGEYISF
jgi:hypothetical protein